MRAGLFCGWNNQEQSNSDLTPSMGLIIIIIIESFYSLWSIGHPWRASMRCPIHLSPWPRSMIFLYSLFHPLLSFATFSSAYLFFYTPEDSNLMRFSLLLPLLYVMCVLSNSIFLFFIWISIGFYLVSLHSSSFVILSVHFIFIIRLKHLFIHVCNLLVIWLAVFQVSQAYNNIDFTFVLNIRILTPFDIKWLQHVHTYVYYPRSFSG